MQNLVSKNPIQRFKQGKRIIKAQGGYALETHGPNGNKYYTRNSQGKLVEKPSNFKKPVLTKNIRNIGKIGRFGRFLRGAGPLGAIVTGSMVGDYIGKKLWQNEYDKAYNLGIQQRENNKQRLREHLDQNSEKMQFKSPTITSDQSAKKATPGKRTTSRSGWSYGFGPKDGITDIAATQRMLKEQGYYADDENSNADGKWGQSTENAYQRYLNKQKAMELPPEVVTPPTETKVVKPLESAKPIMITTPQHPYSTQNLKAALGKNNNFQGLADLVWGDYANDDNNFNAVFSRDMRKMFSKFGTKQDWLDNQQAIENALNISGRYRGTRAGDYGDLFRALGTYGGFTNYINGYKIGGLLVSRNPIKRFKQGGVSSFGKAFREARAAGLKEFEWNGKKYHTRTKEENDAIKRSTTEKKEQKNLSRDIITNSGHKLYDSQKKLWIPDSSKNIKFIPK